jgi:hypothetical protein
MTKEERIQKAVALFKEGYNCSQSVVGAYADMYGFTFEQALHMAASFGGGIGRMREICGAACDMFLLAGLERCAVETADRIMESLASPAYRAEVGTNGNFILMHSVGSIPHGAEIDVPLNYADYYFLEALKRKRDLEK